MRFYFRTSMQIDEDYRCCQHLKPNHPQGLELASLDVASAGLSMSRTLTSPSSKSSNPHRTVLLHLSQCLTLILYARSLYVPDFNSKPWPTTRRYALPPSTKTMPPRPTHEQRSRHLNYVKLIKVNNSMSTRSRAPTLAPRLLTPCNAPLFAKTDSL